MIDILLRFNTKHHIAFLQKQGRQITLLPIILEIPDINEQLHESWKDFKKYNSDRDRIQA